MTTSDRAVPTETVPTPIVPIPSPPAPQSRRRRETRRTLIGGVLIGVVLTVGFGLIPRQLELAEAEMIADRVMANWQRANRQPAWRFARRETRAWADGWEMRWPYRPCADRAALRVLIARNGHSVQVTEYPECSAASGISAVPLRT